MIGTRVWFTFLFSNAVLGLSFGSGIVVYQIAKAAGNALARIEIGRSRCALMPVLKRMPGSTTYVVRSKGAHRTGHAFLYPPPPFLSPSHP